MWMALEAVTVCAALPVHAQDDAPPDDDMLYRSDAFSVTDTSVEQGPFEAVAASRSRITSSYPRAARMVNFKFSINGKDNELVPGEDHMIHLRSEGSRIVTPVYTFGTVDPVQTPVPQLADTAAESDSVAVVFRLDLRPVLENLREKGSYDPPVGERVEALDGVYVVGNVAPLTWDFGALRPGSRYELHDPDGDGIYTATLPFEAFFNRPLVDGRATWTLSADLSDLPHYRSGQRLVDALYRLSLEEMLADVRTEKEASADAFPAGTFSAGAKWPGVWTRDISYSILLSLALVAPERSKASLMAKVDSSGRIIQDTGTGGSWPVSTDRMTWALAAWEVYAVTGEQAWLRRAYRVIRRSAKADRHAAFDEESGLFRGESSFLDWREQSYPRWMDPKDIYLSENLGTNAVHYATYQILAKMARRLDRPDDEAARYEKVAGRVKAAINEQLWRPERGYYGAFRYGRNSLSTTPRAEALGNALAVLFGVASPRQRKRLFSHFPAVDYGVPTIYPYAEGIPPYHNASIWPFAVAFWTWAGADAGRPAAVEHGLASLYRAAGLFLTNKENMVARTGHFEGTEVNSDRQLWSVAGTLASVYRVLFGMRFEADRLVFDPFVPEAYAGRRVLEGVTYRDAELTVTVEGYGDGVASATLDGQPLDEPAVPSDLTGTHRVTLRLDGDLPDGEALHRVGSHYMPRTPEAHLDDGALAWEPVEGAARYRVLRNGRAVGKTQRAQFPLPQAAPPTLDEYQVQATGADSYASFLSEPVRAIADGSVQVVQAPPRSTRHDGYTGDGYTVLEKRREPLRLHVEIEEAGRFALDARYANGSGPVNSDNKAALRTLRVDGAQAGVLVMPQRGNGAWDDWGYSNPVSVRLSEGRHTLQILFTPADENMNTDVNKALLDQLRLTRLEK